MNTTSEAVKTLAEAQANAKRAVAIIEDLITAHDYQDVALLITQTAVELLESASLLMQSHDEDGLEALERADDLLDEVWNVIVGDVDLDEDDE